MTSRMTASQRRIIAAVEKGNTTTRTIAAAVGMKANSNIARQLQALAAQGHIVLKDGPHGLTVATGDDFCKGWDLAARLAGNPEA